MDDRLSNRQMIGTLVFLLIGPIIWAADLTIIYGAQSSLCAFRALDQGSVGVLVVATTAVLILLDALVLLRPHRFFRLLTSAPPPAAQWDFLRGTMRLLAALSGLAMLYFGAAALLLPACAQLR
jgi:hypothetical protein